MSYLIAAIIGLVVGGTIAWAVMAKRAASFEAAAAERLVQQQRTSEEIATLRATLVQEQTARVKTETQLAETARRLEEEKKLLEDARHILGDTFKSLAGQTLAVSTSEFLKLAQETFNRLLIEARGDLGRRQEAIQGLIKPMEETLKKFEQHVREIESKRDHAYATLTEQLRALAASEQQLQKETANLVTALRRPHQRGRWGEVTLRRVVELAGMTPHCDFTPEVVTKTTEDTSQRPDLVVHLPGARQVIVDAKVALDAYLDAIVAETDEGRTDALRRHAQQVRRHMHLLASKSYWNQFPQAPEFVVMFMPGEPFLSAAVECEPSLIEDGLAQGVIVATPVTLMALLRAVAFGWRQEHVARNAQEISNLGRELYERMRTLAEHISNIGESLKKAVENYNKSVGSIEGRVLPAARRFKDLGVIAGDDIPPLSRVEVVPRTLSAPEANSKGSDQEADPPCG